MTVIKATRNKTKRLTTKDNYDPRSPNKAAIFGKYTGTETLEVIETRSKIREPCQHITDKQDLIRSRTTVQQLAEITALGISSSHGTSTVPYSIR